MKTLKSMLTESAPKLKTSDDPKDLKGLVMPGITDTGIYGVIVGRPFAGDDVRERGFAEHLVTRTLGLRIDDMTPEDWADDFERSGQDISEVMFVYFYDGNSPAYCVTLGAGGVSIILN